MQDWLDYDAPVGSMRNSQVLAKSLWTLRMVKRERKGDVHGISRRGAGRLNGTYRIILHPGRISFDASHRVDDGDRLNTEASEFRELFLSLIPTVSHLLVRGSSGTGLALAQVQQGRQVKRIPFHGSLDLCPS